MKNIYLVRHCSADGQHKDSPLTKQGLKQSRDLCRFFMDKNVKIDSIISSPHLRAIESIKPYANEKNLSIEIEEALMERILSEEPLEDWMDILEDSFSDYDFKISGGESSNEALSRANRVLHKVLEDDALRNVIMVTHGNLLSLIISQYDSSFGFRQWMKLQNPDVYRLTIADQDKSLEHLWNGSLYV
ncbi:histidine phosphatase family protein [Oceanobacillus piezotolerans]|uniref:Histidine phosphatase family protein n=1 Tax=Oceanobacillus piezotolerans TaxID=2448030 RepID=A0A498DFE4_9BACI|nr:histidine phosphatase family protein [Oceanobacillus piezotolerans]RLL48255.1 histidine phosphatase family protein [Oceanobacillus piezotolerans]